MPYARYSRPAQDAAGNLLTGIWCEVRREDVAGNPLETLFADRMGDVGLSNPFYTVDGVPEFFSAGGAFRVRYYKTGYDHTERYVGVGLAAEGDLQGFVPMGAWDNATTYDIGDMVTHPNGGTLYLFASKVSDNLNNAPNAVGPADTAFWVYLGLAVQGPAGPAGVIGIWRGEWVSGGAYLLNDAVQHDGAAYIALSSHTAGASFSVDLSAGKWDLVAAATSSNLSGPVKIGHTKNDVSYVGLQIGGAIASEGTDGSTLALDSFAGWNSLQNTKEGGVTELAIQPKALASQASIVLGGNTVTSVNGIFNAGLVGKRIYLGATAYLVSAYTDTTHVTVTNLNGSAASFPASATITALMAYAGGTGLCNTSGTAVTRVSGDPFVPVSNTPYKIKINGTTYTVSSWTDVDTLVLTGSAGTQSNVAYEWWTSVDDIVSALRVHRISRAGFEENVSLIAYGTGKFHLHAGGGSGRQYPLHIGSGYKTSGAERDHITLAGDGYTYLGGDANAYSMRVGHADDVAGNVFEFLSTPTGFSPSLRARGADTDVGIGFDTKGNGAFIITSGSFTGRDLVVYGNHAGDYLALGGISGAPFIEAAGASTNIDIALIPKGTGGVRVGSTRVLTTRRTGWGAATGTATRTTFATGSVTLPLLAERVKALIDDLITHGLIGA